jgi:hypothetical protein
MPAIVRHTIHQFNNSLLEREKKITSLNEHLDHKIYSKPKTLKCKRKRKFLFKSRQCGNSLSLNLSQYRSPKVTRMGEAGSGKGEHCSVV